MEVLLCAFVYPPGPHREKFIADNSTKFTRDQRLLLDHIIILSNRIWEYMDDAFMNGIGEEPKLKGILEHTPIGILPPPPALCSVVQMNKGKFEGLPDNLPTLQDEIVSTICHMINEQKESILRTQFLLKTGEVLSSANVHRVRLHVEDRKETYYIDEVAVFIIGPVEVEYDANYSRATNKAKITYL